MFKENSITRPIHTPACGYSVVINRNVRSTFNIEINVGLSGTGTSSLAVYNNLLSFLFNLEYNMDKN